MRFSLSYKREMPLGKYSVIAGASGARVDFANWAVEDWNSQGIGEALFFSLKYLEKG